MWCCPTAPRHMRGLCVTLRQQWESGFCILTMSELHSPTDKSYIEGWVPGKMWFLLSQALDPDQPVCTHAEHPMEGWLLLHHHQPGLLGLG